MIGFLRIRLTPVRDLPLEGVEPTPITRRAWRQDTLDGRPILGHEARHVEPIPRAFRPRHASSRCRVLGSLRPWHPIRVTDNDGTASHATARCRMAWLPGGSEELTQHHEQLRETMEPTGHTLAAEPGWHSPRPAQEGRRGFTAAANAPPGPQVRRDDVGIAQLRLRVVGMAARVHAICPDASNGQDRSVQGRPRLAGGRGVASSHPGRWAPWRSRGGHLG
jgi:hypothetical protein